MLYSCGAPDLPCMFTAQVPWEVGDVEFEFTVDQHYKCPRIGDEQVIRTFEDAKSATPHLSVPSLPFQRFFIVSTKDQKFVYLGDPSIATAFGVMSLVKTMLKGCGMKSNLGC